MSAGTHRSITPEDASPAGYVHVSLHSLAIGSEAARCQDELMDAIAAPEPNIVTVRNILATIREDLRQPVLLSPSSSTRHKLRTPLMAAAATSEMPIVGAVLAAFGDIFYDDDNDEKGGCCTGKQVKPRTAEMQRQLEMVDVHGKTLLMHACAGTSAAVFQALCQTVQPSQFREVIKARDSRGMTMLHHAVNGHTDERALAGAAGPPPTRGGESLPPVSEGGGAVEAPPAAEQRHAFSLDQRLPVIHSVLEFAKTKLWMPEYRKLLQARDGWHRSIIEHAIMSGRTQIFEAVFDALRKDIHDEKIDMMLEPGVESSHAQTSLSRALESQAGTPVPDLVREKAKALKSDVSKRKDDSTVASKIQSFIPGNLIVIFQLLLPEFDEEGDAPFYLLLILCFIAPFWSWGAAMSSKRDPETKNTRARQTAAKYFLAIPAMFFWGIGTSKIGTYTFSWPETASAAALAVATIVIPAIDTYCSGRGLRATVSVITISLLDLFDGKKTKKTRAEERSNQLYGQDDIAGRRHSTSTRPPDNTFGGNNPRSVPLVDSHTMEAGRQRPAPATATGSARRNAAAAAAVAGGADHGSPRSDTNRSQVESIWGEEDDVEMELSGT